jgi:lipopolysaccharide transport system ATP-binding protein
MSAPAISVRGLGKRYAIGAASSATTFRESIMDAVGSPFRALKRLADKPSNTSSPEIWALKDVSFEVKPGEVIGIIGRNGAGKSTLLKVLSRITEPTVGSIELRGRVGSLLEVGTGFHPELTGRDNIFLNGAILGMSRKTIEKQFDEIVAFAEVDAFVDTPVKRYSSGMYLRLAFAVAAHLEPEILVVDEVLAVGDAAFQSKCLGKMQDVASDGRTVLFVSHNMAAVQRLCSKAMVLRDGRLDFEGETDRAIAHYLSASSGERNDLSTSTERSGSGAVRLRQIALADATGTRCDAAYCGQDIQLQLDFELMDEHEADREIIVHVYVATMLAEPLFVCSTAFAKSSVKLTADAGSVRCCLPRLPLAPGDYQVSVAIKSAADRTMLDYVPNAMRLTVIEGDYFGTGRIPPVSAGPLLVDNLWEAGSIPMNSVQIPFTELKVTGASR